MIPFVFLSKYLMILYFDPNLTIPLPETEDEIKDKNYLKEKVQELIKKRSVKSYWRDIVKEKETSFLLSIVDDTGEKSGMKRKNILNPIIKYIGINSILIGKTFACYILLSDKDSSILIDKNNYAPLYTSLMFNFILMFFLLTKLLYE